MRKTLLTLALCLWASVAHAQLSLVQYKLDPDATPWATDGIEQIDPDSTLTAGNTVVVGFVVGASNRSVSSVVDAGSNTYALAASCEFAGTHEIWFYSSILSSNATSVTVTLSPAAASSGNLFLWEISGAHASDSIGGSACAAVGPSTTGHSSGTVTAQGSSSFYVGAVYGSNTTSPGWVKDADYTSNTQSTTLATAYRSTTGNDSFDSTTGNGGADSETSVSILVEVLPAAASADGSRILLLGVGR